MSKHPEDDLVFAGDSADNAEDFITAVNRASWRAGKQEDSKWTAQLAYSCFAKGALIWYEGLSDNIKQDWKLLRTAIILEYVAPSGPTDTPGESSSGSNQKDRNRRGTVIGRIRVNYTTAGRDWYLASKLYDDTWSTVSSTVDGAALFQFNTTKKTIKYLGTEDFLMLGSYKQESNLFSDPLNFFGVFKLSKPVFHGTQIKRSWNGPIQSGLWSLEGKNRIQARWVSDNKAGDYPELQAVIFDHQTEGTRVYLVPDPLALFDVLKSTPGSVDHARLYFEPIDV